MRLIPDVLGIRCIFLACLFAPASALATDESLSFRRTASGSIEALVSGITTGCEYVFLPPNEVAVEGATLTITSPGVSGMCYLPHPPTRYSVTADLGILQAQRYQVVWNQPVEVGEALQLSAVLLPAAIVGGGAISAPTMSWWGLSVLTLVLGAFAGRHRNFTRSKI